MSAQLAKCRETDNTNGSFADTQTPNQSASQIDFLCALFKNPLTMIGMRTMITPEWMQFMARYNRWQNDNIFGAADSLTNKQRNEDRGMFFGSIQRTLSHILWADQLWLNRLAGTLPPAAETISTSATMITNWQDLKTERLAFDEIISTWAAEISQNEIDSDLEYYSKSADQNYSKPSDICIMQVFNHQTHHRGQVHAILTSMGAKPGDTDIPYLPDASA